MTWLMWPWCVRIPSRDLTGVTLVSDDTYRRLDWCDSGEWRWLLETWLIWLWWVMIPKEDLTDVTLVSGDTFLRLDWCDSGEEDLADVTLVSEDTFYWWKLCIDESCLLMKVVYWCFMIRCSFSAFISKIDTKHIFQVLSTPTDQEMNMISKQQRKWSKKTFTFPQNAREPSF